MPRKINRRKAIQAAKRRAAAEEEGRQNKRWTGTRKTVSIAHAGGNSMSRAAALAMLIHVLDTRGHDQMPGARDG